MVLAAKLHGAQLIQVCRSTGDRLSWPSTSSAAAVEASTWAAGRSAHRSAERTRRAYQTDSAVAIASWATASGRLRNRLRPAISEAAPVTNPVVRQASTADSSVRSAMRVSAAERASNWAVLPTPDRSGAVTLETCPRTEARRPALPLPEPLLRAGLERIARAAGVDPCESIDADFVLALLRGCARATWASTSRSSRRRLSSPVTGCPSPSVWAALHRILAAARPASDSSGAVRWTRTPLPGSDQTVAVPPCGLEQFPQRESARPRSQCRTRFEPGAVVANRHRDPRPQLLAARTTAR